MATTVIETPRVVSREEWLAARRELLAREKQLTRAHEALAAERRRLPWVKVEEDYVFDSPAGRQTLAELFGGKSQLIVYHFMFAPEWREGCPSCSFLMDHTDGMLPHLAQRDVAFTAVSRAPIVKIEEFRKRMGWKFHWVSSYGNRFNHDYQVSFTKEELSKGVVYNFTLGGFPSPEAHGLSVFCRQGNEVFHTYSTFGRGLETIANTYNYLDLVPKGRDEDGLYFPLSWVRHHDRYADGRLLDTDRPYWPPEPVEPSAASCCAGKGA